MNRPDPASSARAGSAADKQADKHAGAPTPDTATGQVSAPAVRDKAQAKDEYGHSSGDRNTRTEEGTWTGFKDGEQRGKSHGPETSEPADSGPASERSPAGHPARASGKTTD